MLSVIPAQAGIQRGGGRCNYRAPPLSAERTFPPRAGETERFGGGRGFPHSWGKCPKDKGAALIGRPPQLPNKG